MTPERLEKKKTEKVSSKKKLAERKQRERTEGAIRGRRPNDKTPYVHAPPRQLGRVHDTEWAELQAAAKRSEQTFTKWALTILLKAAKR